MSSMVTLLNPKFKNIADAFSKIFSFINLIFHKAAKIQLETLKTKKVSKVYIKLTWDLFRPRRFLESLSFVWGKLWV
jgi:hypothetical protein